MPARPSFTAAQLEDVAVFVVASKRRGMKTEPIARAIVAHFGCSISTARRLRHRPDFIAAVRAAESKTIDDLRSAADDLRVEREHRALAAKAPPRPVSPEQGRILAPPLPERAVLPGWEITGPNARERVTGLSDTEFERQQLEAFRAEDERRERAGYRLATVELDIVATRPRASSVRDGYSTAELLERAVSS